MAELATLARPYANAVFALARDNQALALWARRLALLGAAADEERVRTLLHSPEVPAEQKAFHLADLCGDEVDECGRKFLQVLARNGRLPLLGEISRRFDELQAAEERNLDVQVRSTYPLTDAQAERLKDALQAKFGKAVRLTSEVDAKLLGGAVVRAGDTVIDGSVRGRLDKLAESLVGA